MTERGIEINPVNLCSALGETGCNSIAIDYDQCVRAFEFL